MTKMRIFLSVGFCRKKHGRSKIISNNWDKKGKVKKIRKVKLYYKT